MTLARAAAGRAGEEGLYALAGAYRSFIKDRPGLYEATVRSYRISYPDDPKLAAAEAKTLGPVLAVLSSCGIRGDDGATRAARGLRSVARGPATLEGAGVSGIDPNESFRRLMLVQRWANVRVTRSLASSAQTRHKNTSEHTRSAP